MASLSESACKRHTSQNLHANSVPVSICIQRASQSASLSASACKGHPSQHPCQQLHAKGIPVNIPVRICIQMSSLSQSAFKRHPSQHLHANSIPVSIYIQTTSLSASACKQNTSPHLHTNQVPVSICMQTTYQSASTYKPSPCQQLHANSIPVRIYIQTKSLSAAACKQHTSQHLHTNQVPVSSCMQMTYQSASTYKPRPCQQLHANDIPVSIYIQTKSLFKSIRSDSDFPDSIHGEIKAHEIRGSLKGASLDNLKAVHGHSEGLKALKVVGFTVSDEDQDGGVHMEGYLFKKTKHAFKAWVRRWFSIEDNQLKYQKRSKDNVVTVMEDDLRLCTVKPVYDIDRRFCFEVLSPSRSHMLQAHTEEEFQAWVTAIQSGVTRAYREAERRQTENEYDTGSVSSAGGANSTSSLASLDTESAGQPKKGKGQLGFGVHVSKVRSITLDTWEPELFKVMSELGNDVVNRIYLVNEDDSFTKPTPESDRNIKEAWIKAKYVQKQFVSKLQPPKSSSNPDSKVKGWRVKKKTRKSPAREIKGDNSKQEGKDNSDSSPLDEKSSPDSDESSGWLEAVLAAGRDTDSGVVPSMSEDSVVTCQTADLDTSGVIVFGTDIDLPDFELDVSSESSGTEEDTKSTSSWEDMSTLDPNMLLYRAAQARNVPVMLEALANGADINWVCTKDGDKTPLMKAVETGSLSACEFLLLNRARLDRMDNKGRTPLLLATSIGNTGQVCQFLKRGADIEAKDNEGNDALSIAVAAANADIVTLLRLAKLNIEMRESDDYLGSNPGDETFNDVFRDFTNMASNNPEKTELRI
ncbi:ACAP2-like protein [Mya arenaria]|uniref:ACAP2-like protein n=1 Tax=Mya arenaria TaxID=6604 RepID=A0ABY7F1Z2_MYAAR|nr:ACAP2-like protein [Mya arenaria]